MRVTIEIAQEENGTVSEKLFKLLSGMNEFADVAQSLHRLVDSLDLRLQDLERIRVKTLEQRVAELEERPDPKAVAEEVQRVLTRLGLQCSDPIIKTYVNVTQSEELSPDAERFLALLRDPLRGPESDRAESLGRTILKGLNALERRVAALEGGFEQNVRLLVDQIGAEDAKRKRAELTELARRRAAKAESLESPNLETSPSGSGPSPLPPGDLPQV